VSASPMSRLKRRWCHMSYRIPSLALAGSIEQDLK